MKFLRKMRSPNQAYLEQAAALPKVEQEVLKQRAFKTSARRLEDRRKSLVEIVALQLEFEDQQLAEWRVRVALMRQPEPAQFGSAASGPA